MKKKAKILADLEKEIANRSATDLKLFFKKTWPLVEPNKSLLWNWHHELIAEYLHACTIGQIKRLIVNIPPRYTKSNLISVSFPTWLWIKRPELRFIFTSYSQSLSTKHNTDRRMIIESNWYRGNYSKSVQISTDQNMKTEFQNTHRGHMIATSMTGTATGKGCDYLVIDDPLNARQAESDTFRNSVNESFDRTFSTRLDDKKNGVIIVVMQRLHQNDLTGHLLEQGGWEHLKIQGVSQENKIYSFPISKKEKEFKAGELLHEARENQTEIESQKINLGSYGFAGQYLQEPSPAGGAIFKRSWFKFWKVLPAKFDEIILSFDMAFKESNDSDFVVGQCWGRKGADKYLIDQVRSRMDFITTIQAFKHFTLKHPLANLKLVEDKANGTAVINTLRQEITGIVGVSPKDSKESRALSVSPEFEAGNIYLPSPDENRWILDYIEEMIIFPNGRHDDQVDATTQALQRFKHRVSGNFLAQNKNTSQTLANSLDSGDNW